MQHCPTPTRDIVVFDLDGTLADIEHRKHLVAEKKWPEFYAACVDDKPHEAVITILREMHARFQIYIVTGRSDEVRRETESWLALNNVPYHQLIMRDAKDYAPDNQLKLRWVTEGLVPKERILCVFEDRNKVVKMWRDAGITCFQVAEGNF